MTFPKIGTSTIPYEVAQTILGNRFNSEKLFSGVAADQEVYFLFENPIDSGVIIELQERKLKTDTAGLVEFQILWDYDVSTAVKTAMPVFNQNNEFRTKKPGKAEVSVLNAVTLPVSGVGPWDITGNAIIADLGIEREPDFISTSGLGANTQGDISPQFGVRIYEPGTGFLTRAVNNGSANRILWGYDWFEIPI